MRQLRLAKTQYYAAASLDGFLADKNNGLEWLLQFGDEPTEDYLAFIAEVGALAMGATTYEWIYEQYMALAEQQPQAQAWPYSQPTWVFTSRKLPLIPGADIRFVAGDVRPVHQEMADVADGRNIWIVGGGELAAQFHDHGLLDEIIVTFASVTLGDGKPLLPRAIVSPPLRLVSARTYGSNYAQLTYTVQKVSH
jgi:dihydrofolate reductase